MTFKTVLVVEDEAQIREELVEVFTGEGFPVIAASNGLEALQLLESLDVLPGIIFLDINMPVMDGQQFLIKIQKLQEYSRFSEIPVAIVSAARSEIFGRTVAFVRKPPQIEQLIELAFQYGSE